MFLWFVLDCMIVILIARKIGDRYTPFPDSILITALSLTVLMGVKWNFYLATVATIAAMSLMFWKIARISLLRSIMIGTLFIVYKFTLVWLFSLGFEMRF